MRSLSSRLDLPLGWLAVSVLMQTELCSQISWNLIKSNEPLGSAYILENCIRRDFLHSERVSFLLASMDQRTDFSLRGFKKKTASLQVESRFCTVTIATCSPESIFFLSRLFPSGLNKQCGMESPVQCTADVTSAYLNVCINWAIRVEVTLQPRWQCDLTDQLVWIPFRASYSKIKENIHKYIYIYIIFLKFI